MTAAIPGMRRRFPFDYCPECDRRWLISRWNATFYPMHYASVHLGIPIWRKL
jgi:hypothetical protein